MTATARQLTVERMKEVFGSDVFAGDVFAGEPMKDRTTLRIGGPADIYAMPKNMLSLIGLLGGLKDGDVPFLPVGGGSNMLVSDDGIDGVVISTVFLDHVEIIEEGPDEVRLFVEAGTPLQKLVNLAKAEGYAGIEGLAGIPGSFGGALWGNAGSFGFEIGNVVEAVTVADKKGTLSSLEGAALGFGYRRSAIPGGTVIVSGNVRLTKDAPSEVVRRAGDFLREKMRKQPIAQFSAGCVFKNPTGSHAGRLLDEAGCKGMRRGGVEVSSLHANFFVNRGGGTASEYMGLMEEVKERVQKFFGVELEPEIRIVGRFGRADNR